VSSLRLRLAWRNLWSQKIRTLAVILSIAVGVFAFGIIGGAANTLTQELPVHYLSVQPASAILHTSPVDDAVVDAVARMPAVATAEGRTVTRVRYRQPDGRWQDMQLLALDDYMTQEIDIIRPWKGAWPPPDQQVLIERNSLAMTGVEMGDSLLIEMPDGTQRSLPVAGLVHDMNQPPAQITGIPYAYVTRDTLPWLGLGRGFNAVHFVVADRPFDKAHIEAVALDAADKVAADGHTVLWTEVPEPGEHFAQEFLPTILLILGMLAVLTLLLSAFLIINVITAMLTQQTRQIGVMKTLGAKVGQVRALYISMVTVLGLLALALAVPLGILGGQRFAVFMAGQLNFDLVGVQLVPSVIALQIAVGVLTPLLAALYPVRRAARMTVREAIQDQGVTAEPIHETPISALAKRVQERFQVQRPIRLSLRNTFRRRGRLIRTLIPLILGGAVFMSVLSVRASLFRTLEETLLSQGFDVQLVLSRPYRTERIAREAAEIPAISGLEGWTIREGVFVRGDETESEDLIVYALPPATELFEPDIVAGRWLEPTDRDGIVVAVSLTDDEPDLQLDSEVTLRIGGRERDWRVVGIYETFQPPIAPPAIYLPETAYWRAYGGYDHADTIRLITTKHDAATHNAVLGEMVSRLERAGIEVKSTRTASEDRSIFTERFNIITVILSFMAALLALVGGLGLMATMSINVLERTREIGVMRAIGAPDRAVLQVFIVEGVIIGILSWFGALLLSQPMSRAFTWRVGMTMVEQPLSYVFNPGAPLLWLFIVVVLAAVASFIPARSAASLSVRETIAYE
jgi:putative ABC transport system permease protein